MADTQLTDLNLTTSLATYFANKLAESGWAVYWQARDVMSGTATNGEVTIVAEFPNEPSNLVLPPKTRTEDEVLLPAFSVQLITEPFIVQRAGLGEALFERAATFSIDGFLVDQAQHMAFATMFRNWFYDGVLIPVRDYESNPDNPSLIDVDVRVETERIERFYTVDQSAPRPLRYYLSTQIDISFFD